MQVRDDEFRWVGGLLVNKPILIISAGVQDIRWQEAADALKEWLSRL